MLDNRTDGNRGQNSHHLRGGGVGNNWEGAQGSFVVLDMFFILIWMVAPQVKKYMTVH